MTMPVQRPNELQHIQATSGRVTLLKLGPETTCGESTVVLLDGFTLATFYALASEAIGSSDTKEATRYAHSVRAGLAK